MSFLFYFFVRAITLYYKLTIFNCVCHSIPITSWEKNKGSTDIHISKEWIGISRAFCVEYYYVDSMWRNWIIKKKKREGAAIIIIIGMVRLNEPGRRWEKKKKGGIRHGKIVGVPPYRRCAPSLWHRDAVCSCVWESDVIFPSVVTSNLRVAPPSCNTYMAAWEETQWFSSSRRRSTLYSTSESFVLRMVEIHMPSVRIRSAPGWMYCYLYITLYIMEFRWGWIKPL